MGKGDKKSKRGKLFTGSYGVRRRKKVMKKLSVVAKPSEVQPVIKEPKVVKEIKEVKEIIEVKDTKVVKQPAPPKTIKTAPSSKKEAKPKKIEND